MKPFLLLLGVILFGCSCSFDAHLFKSHQSSTFTFDIDAETRATVQQTTENADGAKRALVVAFVYKGGKPDFSVETDFGRACVELRNRTLYEDAWGKMLVFTADGQLIDDEPIPEDPSEIQNAVISAYRTVNPGNDLEVQKANK